MLNKHKLLGPLLILLITFGSLCTRYKVFWVSGISMQPTYYNLQPLVYHRTTQINRNDVVVFTNDEGETLIKRVTRMPGEIYSIIQRTHYKTHSKPIVFKLKKDSYWVEGDNKGHTIDSNMFGPIKKENILGVVGL